MWPFTSRRILGNRWWALAFVAFVCWQVVETSGSDADDNVSDQDAQALAGVLNIQ